MKPFRKILTATIAAIALGSGVAMAPTPAAAWCNAWGCGGGWGGGGFGGPGALAAGAIGGLALGAIAAGAAAQAGGGTCFERQPIYNSWGQLVGYRRVATYC